jgi:carboxyl-terminal processing protease
MFPMSRRARVLVFLLSTPFVVIVAVGGLLGAAGRSTQQGFPPLRVFEDVVRLILNAYVEPPNIDKVMDGAMKGLVDGLDPDTSYLTPDEVKAIDAKTPLPDGDLGLVISRQFYLRIVGVRDGSPAQRAGLQTGDFIRAINDAATRDMSEFTGERLLRGAPGSKVTLLIIRNGNTGDPHPIDLVREVPKADRATGKRLVGGEAYVRMSSFGAGAAAALKAAVASTGAAANTGLIIDLRDVADGTPEEGIAAARLFVKTGTLAIRAGRPTAPVAAKSASNTTVTRTPGGPGAPSTMTAAGSVVPPTIAATQPAAPAIPDNAVKAMAGPGDGALAMPVVLLISNGTAHAAEIFAAALSNNKRATLVGEPTAGLAGTQKLVRLPEGHGLMLTTERYLQTDGTPIHTRGLRPNALVEIPTIGFEDPKPTTDPVLDRGVQELKSPSSASAAPASPGPATSGAPTTSPGSGIPLPTAPALPTTPR